MVATNFYFLRVSFTEYITDEGINVKVGSSITGELFDYSEMETEYGTENVGIVIVNDIEIYYVPVISLVQLV